MDNAFYCLLSMEVVERYSYPVPEDCPSPTMNGSCQSTTFSHLNCNRSVLVRENPTVCSSNSDINGANQVGEVFSYDGYSGSIYYSSYKYDQNSSCEESIDDLFDCDLNRVPLVNPILKNSADSSTNDLFGIYVTPDRDYNISLRVSPHGTTDLIHLFKKDQDYPYVSPINGLRVKRDKPFEVYIYKGNSSWGRDCQKIRHIVLKRDKNHQKNEFASFCVFVNVAENGCMSLDFIWEDTKESIPISFYECLDYQASVVHKNAYKKFHDSHSKCCCIF